MAPRSVIALLAGAVLIAAGCGGEDSDDDRADGRAEPPPADRDRPPREDRRDRPSIGDGRGGVRLEQIGELDQPLHVTQAPGERALYVVEQCGRIARLEPGRGSETFLDIGELVSCGGEQGLLSVAFAPDYERSGRLYVDYTDTNGDTRVVEYRRSEDDPARADPDSARELLAIEQPFTNHNGGLVLFGPDRNLYIGTGDGGSAGDPQRTAQDLSSLLGKILRIDPRPRGGEPYRIPVRNPFAGEEGARGEILAYGLRNPWRFSFDRRTDALWIGDVGQDSWEEVDGPIPTDVLDRGPNFGWSAYEGEARFNTDQEAPDMVPPTLTYSIEGSRCSITGGHVVRDPALESLYGRYLYGDLCTGELRSFVPNPGGEARSDRALGLRVPTLSSFGEDAAGRIYAVSLEGPVYRLGP